MNKRLKIKAIPITNIHIGTGKELEPLDYYVKAGEFIRFLPNKIVSSLSQRDRNILNKIIDSNNLKEVAKFLYENLDNNSIIYKTKVSDIIQNEFLDKFSSKENRQIVLETYRDKFDYFPVIPGSSIKGAVRTAVLWYYMKYNNLQEKINVIQREISRINPWKKNDRKKKEIEAQKLILEYNNEKNDPFRAVHVEDCKIEGEDIDTVVKVKNYHLKLKKFRNFVPSVEAIKGKILGANSWGIFYINFFEELNKIKLSLKMKKGNWNPINKKITIDIIKRACNEFYKNNFLYDLKRIGEIANNSQIIKLKNEFNALKNNEFIIRVGRYSQIENITIITHNTKSRMFDENNLPMGYLKLQILD